MTDTPEDADIGAAALALEKLRAALPGFSSRIDAHRGIVTIRGALPIGAGFTYEALHYATGEDARQADLVAAQVVKAIQREAIAAVGLAPVIEEEKRRAVEAASLEAHHAGRLLGEREGRLLGADAILAAGFRRHAPSPLTDAEVDAAARAHHIHGWGDDLDPHSPMTDEDLLAMRAALEAARKVQP